MPFYGKFNQEGELLEWKENLGFHAYNTKFQFRPDGGFYYLGGRIFEIDSNFVLQSFVENPWHFSPQTSYTFLDSVTYLVSDGYELPFTDDKDIALGKATLTGDSLRLYITGSGGDTLDWPANTGLSFLYKDKIYFGGAIHTYPDFFSPPGYNSWWLVGRVDSNLNPYWQKRFGGDEYYNLWGLTATVDGGVIAYGSRFDHNTEHNLNLYVLKLNSGGQVVSETIITGNGSSIGIFPNPGTDHFTVQFTPETQGHVHLTLTNAMGQSLLEQKNLSIGQEISTVGLAKGFYFYKLVWNKTRWKSGKWIKN